MSPGAVLACLFVRLNSLTPSCLQEPYWLGPRSPGSSRERELYLTLHCRHQNEFCIKMGNDGSHFNVSFGVRGKGTGQCPQTTCEEKGGLPPERGIEPTPSAYQPNAVPLGQTGSQTVVTDFKVTHSSSREGKTAHYFIKGSGPLDFPCSSSMLV